MALDVKVREKNGTPVITLDGRVIGAMLKSLQKTRFALQQGFKNHCRRYEAGSVFWTVMGSEKSYIIFISWKKRAARSSSSSTSRSANVFKKAFFADKTSTGC